MKQHYTWRKKCMCFASIISDRTKMTACTFKRGQAQLQMFPPPWGRPQSEPCCLLTLGPTHIQIAAGQRETKPTCNAHFYPQLPTSKTKHTLNVPLVNRALSTTLKLPEWCWEKDPDFQGLMFVLISHCFPDCQHLKEKSKLSSNGVTPMGSFPHQLSAILS